VATALRFTVPPEVTGFGVPLGPLVMVTVSAEVGVWKYSGVV
jgi:hypothetical protein